MYRALIAARATSERPRSYAGDATGRVACLGRAECSCSDANQKMFEETPRPRSPGDAPCLRRGRLPDREQVGYSTPARSSSSSTKTAGSTSRGQNTRLQVEHPVTEMVTGLDLVAEQVRSPRVPAAVVRDEPPVPRAGSEARIIARTRSPASCRGCRAYRPRPVPERPGCATTRLLRGFEIPSTTNSLISKLIVWGRTASSAAAHGPRALRFVIEGVPRTAFHRWLVSLPSSSPATFRPGSSRSTSPESLAPAATPRDRRCSGRAHAREERLRVTLPERRNGGAARSAWRWGERRRPGGTVRR